MGNWKYDHLIKQIHRTAYKPHEYFIIGALIHEDKFKDLLPLTQYYVKLTDNESALIDLFYPQINLAIEIDEPHHNKNSESDAKRQSDIEKYLKCEFVRILISNGNILEEIQRLKTKIFSLIDANKNNWQVWEEPKKQSIATMKEDYKNTLFVKIRGIIKPEELMQRQTGYWRIAQNKQGEIKTVVVVHDSVISKVFTDIKVGKPINGKVGYEGIENTQSDLLGNIVTDWKVRQTITYSNDIG